MIFLHKIIDAVEAQNIKDFIRRKGNSKTDPIWFRANDIDYTFQKGTMYMINVSFTNPIPLRYPNDMWKLASGAPFPPRASLEIFLHNPYILDPPTLFRVEFNPEPESKKRNREGANASEAK